MRRRSDRGADRPGGADPLEGNAENLRHFYDLGVRDIIPAWKDNPFSGTAFGTNTPLTAEGIKLIELAEELRVMVDVSHLSDAAFESVLEVATRPFIASHSNCRALCPTLRNLTDEMISTLSDHGGDGDQPFAVLPRSRLSCANSVHLGALPRSRLVARRTG